MKIKLLPLFLFLCLWANTKLFAQTDIPEKPRPTNFVSYFDMGIGTAGGELGLSARVRHRLATDLFFKAFWHDSDPAQNLASWYLIGIKAKFYQNKTDNSLYAGPLIAAHGFGSALRPLLGLATGYDHYSQTVIFGNDTHTRVGVLLEGGLDTEGRGYFEVAFSFGFGYANNGDIK